MGFDANKDKIIRFDSPQEYADYLAGIPEEFKRQNSGDSWSGKHSYNDAIKTLINGELTHVDKAQAIIDQMECNNLFSSGVPLMRPAVQGYVPIVSAVIQGHPEAFLIRYRDENQSMNTPIAVYIDTIVSGGMSDAEITNRGIAITAFVMALQITRPVELHACAIGDPRDRSRAHGAVVRLGTTPINLGQALWTLTSNDFCRQLGFSAMMQAAGHGGSIGWSWNYYPGDANYAENMRLAMGLNADDVYICGGHVLDKLLRSDPVAWVKQMIEKHCNKE